MKFDEKKAKQAADKISEEIYAELQAHGIMKKLAQITPDTNTLATFMAVCTVLAITNDFTPEEIRQVLTPLVRPDLPVNTSKTIMEMACER